MFQSLLWSEQWLMQHGYACPRNTTFYCRCSAALLDWFETYSYMVIDMFESRLPLMVHHNQVSGPCDRGRVMQSGLTELNIINKTEFGSPWFVIGLHGDS